MLANSMSLAVTSQWLGALAAAGASHAELQDYRLDRLMELRAVIDSLRAERSHRHDFSPGVQSAGY